MPRPLPQEFLEDSLATWSLLRRFADQNAYLSALRAARPLPSPPAETDPYSLRIARRVADVVERLTPHRLLTDGHHAYSEGLSNESKGMFGTAVEESTPRWALCALAADVRRILSARSDAPPTLTSEWAAAIAQRQTLATTVMEGLHVLTLPGVQLRIDGAVSRLRERLREEMSAPIADNQTKALQQTELLLNEFEELYMQILSTFPCARSMGSPHIFVALLPVMHELYGKLGDWVLTVEGDTNTKPGAVVKTFDEDSMRITILREDVSLPWGLRLNAHGRLCGLSTAVRAETPVGNDLHQKLSSHEDGVAIATINFKPVPLDGKNALENMEILEKFTQNRRRLYITLEGSPRTQVGPVEELAFFVPEPTHDMPVERATLILKRQEKSHPWNLAMSPELILLNVPRAVLNKEAAAFVSAHSGRLRVGAINGVEVGAPGQVKLLSAAVNTLVVELQVMTRKAEAAQHHKDKEETTRQMEVKGDIEEKKTNVVHNQDEVVTTLAKEPKFITSTKTVDSSLKNTTTTAKRNLPLEKASTATTLNTQTVTERKENFETKTPSGTVIPELSDAAVAAAVENPLVPDPTGPLSFSNDVTMELLTAEEMILRRNSADQKWGVALRTNGDDSQRKISILTLPELPDTRWQRHPYYQMFNAHAGKWNIRSVNGTAASRLPDVLDILKYALKIQIKFHRR